MRGSVRVAAAVAVAIAVVCAIVGVDAQCDPSVCAGIDILQSINAATATARTAVPRGSFVRIGAIPTTYDFATVIEVPEPPTNMPSTITSSLAASVNATLPDGENFNLRAFVAYLPSMSSWTIQAIINIDGDGWESAQLPVTSGVAVYLQLFYDTDSGWTATLQPDGEQGVTIQTGVAASIIDAVAYLGWNILPANEQTDCGVFPPTGSVAWTNTTLNSPSGPVPLNFAVGNVTPFCSLNATVDNVAGSFTFSWVNE